MSLCPGPLRNWFSVIRDFASHGQLLDVSVALVIGNAFTKVIESLVDKLLTPVLGFLFNGVDIDDLSTELKSNRWPHKAPVKIPYGNFLQQLIYFAIITIMLSIIITIINKLYAARQKAQVGMTQKPTKQELILMEHTELLKAIAYSLRK